MVLRQHFGQQGAELWLSPEELTATLTATRRCLLVLAEGRRRSDLPEPSCPAMSVRTFNPRVEGSIPSGPTLVRAAFKILTLLRSGR